MLLEHRLVPAEWLGGAGAMASLLVRSTPDGAVQVQALAGDIVLCFWQIYSMLVTVDERK